MCPQVYRNGYNKPVGSLPFPSQPCSPAPCCLRLQCVHTCKQYNTPPSFSPSLRCHCHTLFDSRLCQIGVIATFSFFQLFIPLVQTSPSSALLSLFVTGSCVLPSLCFFVRACTPKKHRRVKNNLPLPPCALPLLPPPPSRSLIPCACYTVFR